MAINDAAGDMYEILCWVEQVLTDVQQTDGRPENMTPSPSTVSSRGITNHYCHKGLQHFNFSC